MPLCNAKAPDYEGKDIFCNREKGHGGQHCRYKCGMPYGYQNIWWPVPVKEEKPDE